MNDLKQCPFCGGEAQLLIVPGRVAHWIVKCSKGCCNICQYISDHDAEEAWNKRTTEENQDELLKEYQRIINNGFDALTKATEIIKSQPDVVRCKDCKWWENGLCENDDVARKINDCGCYPDFRTDPDWFCKDGERSDVDA